MKNKFKGLDILMSYDNLGEKKLKDGTVLIGKAPHIAPMAWLHSIYPPLSESDINILEDQIKKIIPEPYKEFLKVSNGLNVFNTTLSLYGLRKNYNRDVEINVWQPFDIIVPNTIEKPIDSADKAFIIGSYDWDGSYLFINTANEKIYLCSREDITPLFEWANFGEMLNGEIKRLSNLFDRDGKELNIDSSTLPIS